MILCVHNKQQTRSSYVTVLISTGKRSLANAIAKSVTIALQENDLDLEDSRNMFDEVLKCHTEPELQNYLQPDSHVVHNPDFETAIRKILLEKESDRF